MKKILVTVIIASLSMSCSRDDNSITNVGIDNKPDNNKIVFREDLPSMTINIDSNRDEIDFLAFGKKEIWADFNGNGEKDKGETPNSFGILYKKNPTITTIHIYGEVEQFYCHEEAIKLLKVSKNPHLEILECHQNYIKSLDVSKNLKLKKLVCHTNEIDKLDVSKNTNLQNLDISRNPFIKEEIEKIFTGLPNIRGKEKGFVSIAYTKGDHTADISIAEKKNWFVITTRPN